MAKLTVWIMTQDQDSECYNIIARTKKDALAQAATRTYTKWSEPKRMTIHYRDAFSLFELATSEAGGRSEYY